MKKFLKKLPLFLVVFSMFGCTSNDSTNDDNPSKTDPDTPVDPDTPDVEESYKIKINAPSTIVASTDKEEAKKGETVKVIVSSVAEGLTILNCKINSTSNATKESETTFSFEMPGRSVVISFEVSVSGDVTIVSDDSSIASSLSIENIDGENIYVARNIKVASSNEDVNFAFKLNGTTMNSLDLDEFECFANITYSNNSEYPLTLASGVTYDFFYSPNAQYPCYVRRVTINDLPQSANGLYSLFDGRYRSESTVNPNDLNKMSWSIKDTTDSSNIISNTYTYKRYDDNTVIGKVVDHNDNEKEYNLYKHYDEDNELFTIVDEYTTAMGNDDPTRFSYNNHNEYSGYFDVVDLDSDDNTRFEMSKREAKRQLNQTAHNMANSEYSIYESYRTTGLGDSFYGNTYYDIKVSSTETDDGFKTTVSTTMEYNITGSTYVEDRQEGIVYSADLEFDKRGAITKLDYYEYHYEGESSWDFTNHKPSISSATSDKIIRATYAYGEFLTEEHSFDTTPYFLTGVSDLHFFSTSLSGILEDDGKTNYVNYGDDIRITSSGDNDKLADVSFTPIPSTAIDIWEYAPTSSSDESVIEKEDTDLYMCMSAVGIGKSTLTFTNHTKNSGCTFQSEVNVYPATEIISVYIMYNSYTTGDWDPVDTATTATVVAGDDDINFMCYSSPSKAPDVFKATSGNEDILKVKSVEKGKLSLSTDTEAARKLTESTVVTVRCTSEYWSKSSSNQYTDLYITVNPVTNVVGNWVENYTLTDEDKENNIGLATLSLTDDSYTEATSSLYTAPKMGQLIDNYSGKDTYNFYYQVKGAYIYAHIYSVSLESSDLEGFEASDFDLELTYVAKSSSTVEQIGVCLIYSEYDSSEYSSSYYTIFGEVDSDGYVESYTSFVRSN